MKACIEMFLITFILTLAFSPIFYAQDNENDKGKSFYTEEEVKQMCGVPVDTLEMKKVLARQDSMYKKYLEEEKSRLYKIETVPNWQSKMSNVENQGDCGSCWVHSATGIVEGQLQILYGSRIGDDGIDMDELEISDACDGGFPTQAENYIQTYKMRSEVGAYPNLQGLRWDIISYNTLSGITAIKNALANGPVAACFYVYADFSPFFTNNPTEVYHYDGHSGFVAGHAVVIVSYDDNYQYWLCKNSWGSDWGDNGYFRIGYGECGIESWENSVVTVNSSCYAKITPTLISSLSTALNYQFVINEWAYFLSGNSTLSTNSNVTTTGANLTIKNGSALNPNGYSITIPNGSITIESGAALNGASLKNGNTVNAIYPSIESALSAATSGQAVEAWGSQNISNNITVNSGITLLVKPNVTLTFGSGKRLNISNYGSLIANNATFIGNGTAGSWYAIFFYPYSAGSIQSCTIKDAQAGIYCNTVTNLTISNSTITNNSLYGFSLINSSPTITNCTIQNNGTGINSSSSRPAITGCTIQNNTNYGITASNIDQYYPHLFW